MMKIALGMFYLEWNTNRIRLRYDCLTKIVISVILTQFGHSTVHSPWMINGFSGRESVVVLTGHSMSNMETDDKNYSVNN
jgi:hypothetical protein